MSWHPQMIPLVISALFITALYLPALAKESSSSEDKGLSALKHTVIVKSSDDLQKLRMSSVVSVVYFFVKDYSATRLFLEEYEKSAKYLMSYNVILAVYDCITDTSGEPMCKKERVQHYIYTYQNGIELLTLEADTMFDVNSIMSNALQLVLLQDVPIIQSRLERQDLQKSYVGKHDLLFAYPQAFGTKEHRIFMEIAYTWQDSFKFALTTEFKTTQGLQDSDQLKPNTNFALWVMLCTESTAEEVAKTGDCGNILYRGDISLHGVAAFVKRLSEPMVHHVPADGFDEVLDMLDTDSIPIIFVYTNKENKAQVMPKVDVMTFELRGFTKIVVMDMDNETCLAYAKEQGLQEFLPALAVKHTNKTVTFMETTKVWSEKNMQAFLMPAIFPGDWQNPQDTSEVAYSTDLEMKDDHGALIEEVETQDDQVAAAVFRLQLSRVSPENIPALMKDTFYKAVELAELKLVLFYLPFDHVGLAFLQDLSNAANVLANNFSEKNVLARVNCFDATDLCSAENITMYPVLRMFQKDKVSQDYMGPLDATSVVKAFKLLQLKGPVVLSNEKDAEMFMRGEYPKKFDEFTPSSVLFLASNQDSADEIVFQDVANSLSTTTAYAVAHGELAETLAKKYDVSLPAVVAYHRDDPNKPIRTLAAPLTVPTLTSFVKESIIASVPELTVMNFPELFAKKKPFAILWLDPADPVSKTAKEMFTTIAMSNQYDTVTFCWMNAQAKTLGLNILSEYVWTATLPMISLVNHGEGEVYNYQAEELKLDEISEWLGKVVAKKERPSKMLEQGKWVAPGRHYDFLAMMDSGRDGEHVGFTEEEEEQLPTEEPKFEGITLEESPPSRYDKALEVDSEIREELLELRNSRLYHQNPERREAGRKQHAVKQEASHTHTHTHSEL